MRLAPIVLFACLPAYASEVELRVRQVAERLAEVEAASFTHKFEMNYASQGYEHTIVADAYVEFAGANPLDTRFLFENEHVVHAYNGSEFFIYDKAQDTLAVETRPTRADLPERYFQCSAFALRRALPAMLERDDVAWKLLEPQSAESFEIEATLPRRAIGSDGSLVEIERDVELRYRIEIRKATMLPMRVTKTDPNGDFMRATFLDLDTDAKPLEAGKWFYSTWAGEKTRNANEADLELIPTGGSAPAWQLPLHGGQRTGSMEDYRGRPILIEFWISHCGYCIEAVPKLNALKASLAERGVELISINAHDSPDTVRQFVAANRPEYPIYESGTEVAANFGVSGYPALFLLDADGIVLYSGGMDPEAIRKAVAGLDANSK